MAKVEQDVVASGGTAYVLEVRDATGYSFAALFERTRDYQKQAAVYRYPKRPFERLLKGMRARSTDDDALLNDAGRLLDDLYLAFQEEDPTT